MTLERPFPCQDSAASRTDWISPCGICLTGTPHSPQLCPWSPGSLIPEVAESPSPRHMCLRAVLPLPIYMERGDSLQVEFLPSSRPRRGGILGRRIPSQSGSVPRTHEMVTFNENPPPSHPCIYIYKKFKYSKLPLSQTRRDRQGIKYCGVGAGKGEGRTKRAQVGE